MTEVATVAPPTGGVLALTTDQHEWTPEQSAALAQIGIDKAPVADQQVFMHVCQRTGLDPFARQIYMIERGGKWTIQTAIDGFRVVSARNDEYAGPTAPQWCGDDGVWRDVWVGAKPPVAARVGVRRHDWPEPAWGVVMFSEFTAGNSMWKSKQAHMIAKVAEAHAHRKAFPNDLAGVFAPEEIERDDRPVRGRIVDAAAAPTVTAAALTGGTPVPEGADVDARMTQPQQKKLFALIRDADIEDRNAWASLQLGRDITSFGALTVADAALLITRLEEGLAALAGELNNPAATAETGA